MDISSLKLDFNAFSKGGLAIAAKIAPLHPFRDGHSVKEEITGRRVTVVFPNAGYQTQDVKVSDPTDAITALLEKGETVYVEFKNFEGRVYDFTDKSGVRRLGISAKADAVRVVPAPASDDDSVML